jgi:hypothetical protein
MKNARAHTTEWRTFSFSPLPRPSRQSKAFNNNYFSSLASASKIALSVSLAGEPHSLKELKAANREFLSARPPEDRRPPAARSPRGDDECGAVLSTGHGTFGRLFKLWSTFVPKPKGVRVEIYGRRRCRRSHTRCACMYNTPGRRR